MVVHIWCFVCRRWRLIDFGIAAETGVKRSCTARNALATPLQASLNLSRFVGPKRIGKSELRLLESASLAPKCSCAVCLPKHRNSCPFLVTLQFYEATQRIMQAQKLLHNSHQVMQRQKCCKRTNARAQLLRTPRKTSGLLELFCMKL